MVVEQRMKHWWGWLGLAVAALAIGVGGCGMERPKREAAPPVADEDRLDWAAEEPYFIVVRTACRTLDVYRYGDRIRSYPAVFGLGGTGGKLHEGDRRTPTGLYSIVAERVHPRWQRFLLLDYPNLHDAERYNVALSSGTIPMLGSQPAGLGGAVGIHGTDKPELNRMKVDWTFGCISLDNADVEDLATLVPVGTSVLIEN
jgi:murein L,D-transpeptidase YafK